MRSESVPDQLFRGLTRLGISARDAMNPPQRNFPHRRRERRRRVVMPARLRSNIGWTDACILNISSHGAMIQSARIEPRGSIVELWRGETVIVARVVWRDGARAGLETECALPVEQILSPNQTAAMTLTAGPAHRRADPCRRHDRRSQGRMIEYVGAVVIACVLAASAFELVERALWRPVAIIESALDD